MNLSRYQPINDTIFLTLLGSCSKYYLDDIELGVKLEFAYHPGHNGTPAKRDKNGSITSYQEIGDPPERAELELLDCHFDLDILKKNIIETIQNQGIEDEIQRYNNIFTIVFELHNKSVFTIQCCFQEKNMIKFVNTFDNIKEKILNIDQDFETGQNLFENISEYLENKY